MSLHTAPQFVCVNMEGGREKDVKVVKLMPTPLSPESFSPFGQVIGPTPDGASFGPDDAQLHLSAGTPRFYIMRLENRPLKFSTITHHASVTQCLGSAGARPWYIGVAKPSIVQDTDYSKTGLGRGIGNANPIHSHAGHHYIPPSPDDVQVFRVEGPNFLKLHVGTWHAGPLFKDPTMDFCNLELSDTNVVDHTTHKFEQGNGVTFEIDD